MSIKPLVQRLCREKNLSISSQSSFNHLIVVDSQLSIDLIKNRGSWLFVSSGPEFNLNDLSSWSAIYKMMRQSLMWPRKNICLSLDEKEQLFIQCSINELTDYSDFEQVFEEYCYFIDTLYGEMTNGINGKEHLSSNAILTSERHAYITP